MENEWLLEKSYPTFYSWLQFFTSVSSWVSELKSSGHIFLNCKMEVKIPSLHDYYED